jgi:sugar lactone lactonase YvrE
MNTRTWSSRALLVASLAAIALVGPSVAASAQVHGQATTAAGGPAVSIPVGPRPESVTKAWGGKFYVSIQGAPDIGLGDGEIRTFDPATGATTTFVTGLDNPRGLAFTGSYLVVTDTTVVWVIDRAGHKRILAGPSAFPHPTAFFNDAAPARGGDAVYVTEMGARTLQRDPNGILWPTDSPQALAIPAQARVYRISLSGKVTEVVTPSRRTLILNGVIESRPGHLLVGDMFYGNIVDVDLHSQVKSIVGTGFRAADGIAQGHDGTIYVASFDNGVVWRMDRDGENPKILLQDVGRSSTADLMLDEPGKRLLIPDTLHNAIIVLPL